MKKNSRWTDVLVIGSIVAVGTGAAWVINDPPEPEVAMGFVSEPVRYPVDIPGCDIVEPPQESQSYGYAISGMEGFDNPAYPWLTQSKVNAMSMVIQDALPTDIDIVSRSEDLFSTDPLMFQPVPYMDVSVFDPGTSADATVVRNGVEGSIAANVSRLDNGPEPCRAGWLDSRETLSDGTVIDTLDTWDEIDGERFYTNLVRVYATDGTRVIVSSSDQDDDFAATGTVPLSLDELRTIAMLDDLRWSTTVSDASAPLPIYCATTGSGDGQFTTATVQRINTALDGFWQAIEQPLVLDRPLGSVGVESAGTANACGAVMVDDGTLTVSVADAGYSEPPSGTNVTTLSDGSELRGGAQGAGSLDGQPSTDVSLVKPSGTSVVVSMGDGTVDETLLQSIALTVASVID